MLRHAESRKVGSSEAVDDVEGILKVLKLVTMLRMLYAGNVVTVEVAGSLEGLEDKYCRYVSIEIVAVENIEISC